MRRHFTSWFQSACTANLRPLHGLDIVLRFARRMALSTSWPSNFCRNVFALQAADAQSVTVIQEDFWDALSQLQPSLSPAELQRYQNLRDHYESRGR